MFSIFWHDADVFATYKYIYSDSSYRDLSFKLLIILYWCLDPKKQEFENQGKFFFSKFKLLITFKVGLNYRFWSSRYIIDIEY